MNNNRLNLYKINDKYIEYMSKFDAHIAYNKENQRPYIGIILNVNNILYFAPMFSPKPQHLKYRDNLTFIKIYGNLAKTDYLGIIKFSSMIPVPKDEVSIIDIKENEQQYNALLYKQYKFINKKENQEAIREKAKKLHYIIVDETKGKTKIFYQRLCCDFKALEEKYSEYNKIKA